MKNVPKQIGSAESTTIEWKQSISEIDEIIETAVAFANTEGGRIFIGVSPEGRVAGVQIGKGTVEKLVNQISQNTDPKLHPKVSTEKIDGKEIFDTAKDRVKRDVKRIMSLTRAITWLYQKQRVVKYAGDMTFIYAEPSDFLNALRIFADFINLTYSGVDHRLQRLLEYTEKNIGKHAEEIKAMGYQERYHDWLLRHKVQKALKIGSVKTIRDWCSKLADKNKLEIYKDDYVSKKTVLIRPVTLLGNNLALPVNIDDIDRLLQVWLESDSAKTIYQNHKITPFIVDFEDYSFESEDDSGVFTDENDMSEVTGEELVVTEEYVCDDSDNKFEHQKILKEE